MRIIIPVIAGIYLSTFFHDRLSIVIGFIIALLLYISVVLLTHFKPVYRHRYWLGVSAIVVCFSFGLLYSLLRQPQVIDEYKEAAISVQIIDKIGETDKNHKYEAYLIPQSDDSVISNKLKGIIYFAKADIHTPFNTADYLYLKGKFIEYNVPNSQFDFDYGNYLRNQRIEFRFIADFYKKQNITQSTIDVNIFAARLKQFLIKRFRENGLNKTQISILNALYLGDKSMLSYKQKSAFSDAGAMHLLAVSGLHTGIVYLILLGFLRIIGIKKYPLLSITVVLLGLWFYALITGFSPSVLRASIMFSILEIGRMSRRSTGIFNLLGASMFIIIIIDPLSVYQVGFWLSHVAVASIICFYPAINRRITFQFPPFRWLWSLIAVSLAAQIGTLPITIFLFNSFPVYFLPANILLIPIVAPILFLAIFASVFCLAPGVLKFILPALADGLSWMQKVVETLNNLPYSTLEHLSFHWLLMPLMYLVIVQFLIYSNYKFTRYLRNALALGIILLIGLHIDKLIRPNEVLFITKVNDKSVVNIICGSSNTIYTNVTLSEKEIEFALKGLWAYCKAPVHADIILIDRFQEPIVSKVGDHSILIVPEAMNWNEDQNTRMKVDYCILMNKPGFSANELITRIDAAHIVLPTAWKWYHIRKWVKDIDWGTYTIHDIKKDGALFVQS